VVEGRLGGGLSVASNRLRISGQGIERELEPFLDTGTAVVFEVPADLGDLIAAAGELAVEVTPLGLLAGQEVAGPSVSASITSAGLETQTPAVRTLRSSDLGTGLVDVDLGLPFGLVSPEDVQLRVEAGARRRLVDATSLDLAGTEAHFVLPRDLPTGVLELALRARLGSAWSPWSRLAGAVHDGHARIPCAASAEGDAGSVWRTDVTLLATGDEDVDAGLELSAGGRMGVVIPSGTQLTLEDLVAQLGGIEVTGSIRVEASGSLLVASRTFNQGEEGTFGQFLAGERPGAALLPDQPIELIGLVESDAFRSNLGLVNDGDRRASLRVELRSGRGALLAERTQTLAAGTTLLVGKVFRKWAAGSEVEAGRITLELVDGERVHAYASIVDNLTGDPTTVPPLSVAVLPRTGAATELWIAAAAATEGVNETQWRTDLVIANPAAVSARVTVGLMGPASPPEPIVVELAAGETARLDDVVGAGGFGLETGGALHLEATVPVVALARVYNLTPGGTYGQLLVAEPVSYGLRSGEEGWLPMLAGPGAFRSNIGLVNPGAGVQTVEIELYAEDGRRLRRLVQRLTARQWLQLAAVLDVPRGYARVRIAGTDGPVLVYASVIDELTGDPTTVPLLR